MGVVVVLVLQETAEERVLIWEELLIGKKENLRDKEGLGLKMEGHKNKVLC